MPDDNVFLSVVRSDDLLALTFELVNLSLDKTQAPPQLIRSQPGQDAFVIVHFPGQHIAESVFDEENSRPINLEDANGLPTVTRAMQYAVTGCVPSPELNGPCATTQWVTPAQRVSSIVQPLVLTDSQAICDPTGTALTVVSSQTRVRGI